MSDVQLVLPGCSVGAISDVKLVLGTFGWYNVGCSPGDFLDVRLMLRSRVQKFPA